MFQELPYPCPKTHCATKSPRLYLWYEYGLAFPGRPAGPAPLLSPPPGSAGRAHAAGRRPGLTVPDSPEPVGPPARLSLGPASGSPSPPAAPVPLLGPGGFISSRPALGHSGMGSCPQTRPSPPGPWLRSHNSGGPVQGIGGEDTAVGRTSGQARKCVLRRGPTPHSLRSSMPSRWDRL